MNEVKMDGVCGVKLEDLLERAERAKKVTQGLLETLKTVEAKILDVYIKAGLRMKDEEKFDYYTKGFRGIGIRYKGSRRFGYDVYLVYIDDDGEYVLPDRTEKIGSYFYYAGDFYARIDYMDRDMVLEVAKNIKGFVINFCKKLTEIANKTEEMQKLAEQVLQALQAVS